MGRQVNLAKPPRIRKKADSQEAAQIAKAHSISARAAMDQAVTGFGSAIDIPRTALSKGAKFGETITTQALTFAVRREPVAKRLVMDVAEDIYDKWFTVHPISKETGEPEQASMTLDQAVQTQLELLQAKMQFTRVSQYERRYGWAILVLGFKDTGDLKEAPTNPTTIDHLAAYSPRAVTIEKEVEDPNDERFGLPEIYSINRGKGKTSKVHHSRVLHVATRLDEHPWQGVPVLEYVWDDMTIYRNMRWAAGQLYWRLQGILKFKFPKNYTRDEIQNFFASLGDPNVRTFIGLTEDKDVEVLGAAGKVLSPEEFTTPILRSISIGSGIPKTKLEGTEAGAVTGSEINQREYYKYVSDQQKLYEEQLVGPLIDKMMEIGQIKPNVHYRLEWVNPFQLDTLTELEARRADAEAAATELQYMLVDEVRAKRALKPLNEVTKGKLNGEVLLSTLRLEAEQPGLGIHPLGLDAITHRLVRALKPFIGGGTKK